MKRAQAYVWGKDVEVLTPNIDSLAKDGAIFSNFNVVAPLCTPSRGSFMTGLYPKFTGAVKNHQPMNDDALTFAEILKQKADYYNGYIGKWHLNGMEKPGFSNEDRRFGFDDIKYQFNRGHWKYFEDNTNVDVPGDVNTYTWPERDKVVAENTTDAYATDFLFNKAIKFIENQIEKDQHFTLMLSIPDPHSPNTVREPYDSMFDHMKFKMPRTAEAAYRKKPALPAWSWSKRLYTDIKNADEEIGRIEASAHWQRSLRNYFGMVKLIDDKVGDLLKVLKDNGLEENTIVVFTSDHGDMMGEHGRYNKGLPYQMSTSVPFIIRYPNIISKKKVMQTAVSSPDFAPTILSLMGIDHSNITFQGKDISNQITNDFRTGYRRQVRFTVDTQNGAWAAAVDRQYKLVVSKHDAPFLFDMKRDPNELVNYADHKKYSGVYKNLKDRLFSALHKYGLPLQDSGIWFDRPACLDSRDQIPIANLSDQVCDDLPLFSQDQCVEDNVRTFCPNSCGICCEDSEGQILRLGVLRTCRQIRNDPRNHCDSDNVATFCPVTCSKCSPNVSAKRTSELLSLSSTRTKNTITTSGRMSPSSSDALTISTYARHNVPTYTPKNIPISADQSIGVDTNSPTNFPTIR